MDSRSQYWDMLVSLKSKHIYYQLYYQKAQWIDICITGALAIFSLGGISGWVYWNNNPALWAAILFFFQALQIINLMLPSNQRVKPLQYMVDEMYYLILEIERDFDKTDNTPDEKIDDLKNQYFVKFNTLEQRYLSGLYMPRLKNYEEKANKELDAYFYSRYNQHISTGGDNNES